MSRALGHSLGGLRARLPELDQPLVAIGAALWFGSCLLAWWRPFTPDWNKLFASELAFLLLAALATAAAFRNARAARGRTGRWTYGALAGAFAIWSLVESAELAFPAALAIPQFDLGSDLAYLLAYSLVLVAAETAAAPGSSGRRSFHLQIELLATVLVVDALLTYFLLLPFNLDAGNSLRSVTWWSYYALFDLLLLARLVPLALRLERGSRRRLLGWLIAMNAFLLVADLSETVWRASGGGGVSPAWMFGFYYSALFAGGVAASTALGRDRASGELSLGEIERALVLPQFSPVLAYVVAFPLLHLLHESLAPSPEGFRTARAALVIATTGVLGGLAAWSWSSFRRHHLRVLDASERATDALARSRHLEAIGRLAAGVAHDFNNRLTVILGYASRLRSASSDQAARDKAVSAILEAADQASRLTMELLAAGRAQPARLERVDLARFGDEIVAEARQLAGAGIETILRLEARRLPVEVDPLHLLRIVWNLAANASDAMPNGGRTELILGARTITSARDAAGEAIPPGDYALLAVVDQGVGMPPETVAKLFDPFFTTKEFGRGSGLGLAALLGLLRTNRGHILVESEVGKGSRFEVLFPLLEDDRLPPA